MKKCFIFYLLAAHHETSGKRLENKTHPYAMESPSYHHATIQRQLESTII